MLFLVLLFFLLIGFVEHMERLEYSTDEVVSKLLKEAKYREKHLEVKRSVKYMNAGYFGG